MRQVVLVYKSIPQYRRLFYEGLRVRLAELGVALKLLYGHPTPAEAAKADFVQLPWAIPVSTRAVKLGGVTFLWHGIGKHLKGADLVIVEQANKLLNNPWLLLQQHLGLTRLAYWGHGKNFQTSSANPLSEWFKRFTAKRVHWWFTYNHASERVLWSMGVPADRITNVMNAIDTRGLQAAMATLRRERSPASLRAGLGIAPGPVGIYAGALYKEKRIAFLLEAAQAVRRRVPDFTLIILGTGPEAATIQAFAASHPWVVWPGPKFDAEKVPYFAVADLFLIPGAVGLAILDGFAFGVPLVTAQHEDHGPEVDYLVQGRNGWMVPAGATPEQYAQTVVELLHDPDRLAALRAGCAESAQDYSNENMVELFAQGILAALERDRQDRGGPRPGPSSARQRPRPED